MSRLFKRLLHFAGSTVEVEMHGKRAEKLADFLFCHYPSAPAGSVPHTTFRLWSNRSGRMDLERGGEVIFRDCETGTAADTLQAQACYQLALESRGGLLFHAAGLAGPAGGLLMPGNIAAGKSTLTGWLTIRGMDYLSDELVYIPEGGTELEGLCRPLHLKHPALSLLEKWLAKSLDPAGCLHSPGSDLVAHSLLNPGSRHSRPPLSRIIFPNYIPGAEASLRPLSKAEAAVALVERLINARNLAGRGYAEAARLARLAPAFRLEYSSFSQLELLVPELLSVRQ